MVASSTYTIPLSGDFSLKNIAELHETLRNLLAEHQSITVDTSGMTSADICTLQLLASARKTAIATGRTLDLIIPRAGALERVLTAAGFLDAQGNPQTSEGDFWRPSSLPSEAA